MSQMNPFFSNQIRMVQDGEDVDFVFEANGSTLTLMTVVDTEVGDFTPDDFIGQNSFFG
ncbi:MAG: hypothetical protein ABUJ98_04090 [Hyphomicrobium sp.]